MTKKTKKTFYNPVDFSNIEKELGLSPPEDSEPTLKTKTYDKEKVNIFYNKVKEEINKMKLGFSELRKGALHIPKDVCPALLALEAFNYAPSEKSAQNFVAIAGQDFGGIAAQTFKKWMEDL